VKTVGDCLSKDKSRKEASLAAKPNTGKFHKFINSRIKFKPQISSLRLADGSITTDRKTMCDCFNGYFKSVFSEQPELYPGYDEENRAEMEDILITKEDVISAIRMCADKSSAGCDDIPNVFYRQCANEISFPLQVIFIQSLELGQLPDEWLISKVSPIFKKGSKLSAENYRPVSLTVVACRIFERIIRNHMLGYVLNSGLIRQNQHGFLPQRSTLTNLLNFLDTVTEKLDASCPVSAVYLDIAKAFDTIPHDKLLNKLNNLGVSKQLFYWIRAFLKNRKQYVALGSSKSGKTSVSSGVPQGSVLGPLLFLLYFESASVSTVNLLKFADDSKLFGTNTMELQDDINAFVDSIHELGMKIAASKCCVLNFGCGYNDYQFALNGQIIKNVKCEKDIGVFVDQNLKFSEHCQQISSKANSLIFRIFSSFVNRDPKIMFSIFKSYVRPILERDSPVWSPYYKQDILRVEGPQRRYTKRLFGYGNDMTYLERLFLLGEETLLVRRVRADLVLVYKIIHGMVDGLEDLIEFARDTRTRGHVYKIIPKPFHVNARKNFFSVRVANLWNKLPAHVVESTTLVAFKANLRRITYNEINLEYFE
jgi:hypothetical protein